jgi:hypothetical protein
MTTRRQVAGALIGLLALSLAPRHGVAEEGWARLAVIAGNNRGADPAATLRFAEDDAARLAQLLQGPGGFAAEDVALLTAADSERFETALRAVEERITSLRARGREALLLVYFSGHSDGEQLELGDHRLAHDALRTWIESSPATLKILIVDACKSGRLLRGKGAAPVRDVHVDLPLDARGLVIVTSSSDAEDARESDRLRASTFTHHLLWALSGAADVNQDQRVTLDEAYQYAYARTVSDTWRTLTGQQRPNIDRRLEQRGGVVLTELAVRDAAIVFDAPLEGAFWILAPDTGQALAQIHKPRGEVQRVLVAAGTYWVAQRRGAGEGAARLFVQPLEVTRGAEVVVSPARMEDYTATVDGLQKGASPRGPLQVVAHVGMANRALHQVAPVYQAQLGLRLDWWRLAIVPRLYFGYADVSHPVMRYDLERYGGGVYVLYRFAYHVVDWFAGLNLAASYGRQRVSYALGGPDLPVEAGRYDETGQGWSGAGGGVGGMDVWLGMGLSLQAFIEVNGFAFRTSDGLDADWMINGVLGAGYRF